MQPIEYIDRATGEKVAESVMGDKALTVPIYSANNCMAANKNLQGIHADSMNEYSVWYWSWAE